MSIRFLHTLYPQKNAIKYISDAIRRTPGNIETVESILAKIKNRQGDLFLIQKEKATIGIVYLEFYKKASVLCPVLVSGSHRKEWQRNLYIFLFDMRRTVKADSVIFVARKGWEKLYPMCKVVGSVYEYRGGSSDK